MTGTLLQIITLTAYGNDFLKNGSLYDDLHMQNSTFKSCKMIEFVRIKKGTFFTTSKEIKVANNPGEWYKYLKEGGCRALRLYHEHSKSRDYEMAGFVGGGGIWLLEAIYDNYSDLWMDKWNISDREDPEQRIWSVKYTHALSKYRIQNLQFKPEWVKKRLMQTLTEISTFAYKHEQNFWGDMFDQAKSVLESDVPENEYYASDLIPSRNYSLTARQVLFAAGKSWVFGGMGSWNDLGFDTKEDNEQYEKLSGMLYSNIIEAVIAAVNSY